MVKREIVRLVDDLDGGEADQTVSFGLDGRAYVIDLSDEHAAHLRNALSEYTAVARSRPTPRDRPLRGTAVTPGPSDRDQGRRIREWARSEGLAVPDRGRIPTAVLDAYRAAAGLRHEPSQVAPGEPGPPPDPSVAEDGAGEDEAVRRWHRSKGYRVPADGSVSGLMRHRYRTAAVPG